MHPDTGLVAAMSNEDSYYYCELKGSLLGDTKPVGDSIYEMRFHFGPGYRIYYARSGSEIYLLLIGGDKRKQQADIKKAKKLFREYSE